MNKKYAVVTGLVMFFAVVGAAAQDHHYGGMNHNDCVNMRGDQAMGFDHMKTTHHFFLSATGGAIQVTANEPSDEESIKQIRMHLAHIAKMFSEGDFAIPMLVHGQAPPGTETMKEMRAKITYKYQEIDPGAKVVISSDDAAALSAIHDFLIFQIKDHQTGDPLKVEPGGY
jgi:hypothetical protein